MANNYSNKTQSGKKKTSNGAWGRKEEKIILKKLKELVYFSPKKTPTFSPKKTSSPLLKTTIFIIFNPYNNNNK